MNKTKIKKLLSIFTKMKYRVKCKGWLYIANRVKLVNRKHIYLSEGVQIASYCLICPHKGASIKLGKNVNIGMFSRIACINNITIGDNVITGPNVFISDYNHAYENINLPISRQGTSTRDTRVIIGEDSWLGTNTVICGNIQIGKHVVIAANSFVNKDVPDYCVVAGSPARIVKKYNFVKECWEKVS